MRPVPLPPNTFPHFYRGGAAIAEFRGRPVEGPNTPEDWVGSTTTRYGEAELGLSRFTDGTLLRDAIAADPVAWLGPEHAAALGTDPGLLVKLLDAGQRLVVHAHPDRAFAGDHLGCRHGKTEAWIVLSADPGAVVYVGFRADVAAGTVRRWVAEQDTGAMLDALNVLPVRAGDAILVPAGVPHAIGAGVFVVELQEPTDFSVLLEWDGFDVDPDAGHLGLGHEVALGCVDRSAWDPSRLARLRGSGIRGSGDGLLPAEADAFSGPSSSVGARWVTRRSPSSSSPRAVAGSATYRSGAGTRSSSRTPRARCPWPETSPRSGASRRDRSPVVPPAHSLVSNSVSNTKRVIRTPGETRRAPRASWSVGR